MTGARRGTMRCLGLTGVLFAPVLAPPTIEASEQEISSADSFSLSCSCSPIRLEVFVRAAGHDMDTATTNLLVRETEDIEIAVRAKLRIARIFTERVSNPIIPERQEQYPLFVPKLRVVISTPDDYFGTRIMDVDFLQYVRIPHNDVFGWAPTWENRGWFGRGRAREMAVAIIEKFIDEYLRVNERACQLVPR